MTPAQHSEPRQDLGELRSKYLAQFDRQEAFTKHLKDVVEKLLRRGGIAIAKIEGRTKDPDGVIEKVGRKKDRYADPLREIGDLTGIRVVTYYLEDIDLARAVIEREFDVEWSSAGLTAEAPPEMFGYESLHYVVTLPERRQGLGEWSDFADLRAEIQVRTALQDAWASVSHRLVYKRDEDAPAQIRRRLARLSALLGLADEQFSLLAHETAELRKVYGKSVESGSLEIPLDELSLRAYLETPAVHARLDEMTRSGGWEPIAVPATAPIVQQDSRDLLSVCAVLELRTISELEQAALSESASDTLRRLREHRQAQSADTAITIEDLLTRLLIIHRRVERAVIRRIYGPEVLTSLIAAMN